MDLRALENILGRKLESQTQAEKIIEQTLQADERLQEEFMQQMNEGFRNLPEGMSLEELANAYERASNRKGAINRLLSQRQKSTPIFSSERDYQQFRNRLLHLRARGFSKLGKYADAEIDLTSILDNERDIEVLFSRANVRSEQENYHAAVEDLNKILWTDGTNERALREKRRLNDLALARRADLEGTPTEPESATETEQSSRSA